MRGIDIVIKNQNGQITEVWDDLELHLFFDCPICKKRRNVGIKCVFSTLAFHYIEKNPYLQLICERCDDKIVELNGYFRGDAHYSLGDIYNKLKW